MTDIISETLAYLGDALECGVYAEVPKHHPESFVTVERTGGGSALRGAVDYPTLAVQSWHQSQAEAAELAMRVDGLMQDMPDEVGPVMHVERNTIYNFPDPDSRTSRWQGVYELTVQ